jgi:hypothetical protein
MHEGWLIAHGSAPLCRLAVDFALGRKQHVDLLEGFDRDRRVLQPREFEKLTSDAHLRECLGV